MEMPGKRTRPITKQSPETFTERAAVEEPTESRAVEDPGFVNEMLLRLKV